MAGSSRAEHREQIAGRWVLWHSTSGNSPDRSHGGGYTGRPGRGSCTDKKEALTGLPGWREFWNDEDCFAHALCPYWGCATWNSPIPRSYLKHWRYSMSCIEHSLCYLIFKVSRFISQLLKHEIKYHLLLEVCPDSQSPSSLRIPRR